MMQSGGFSPADVFTPADVFGATDIGLFNRIHPDNLFTDTNGTINATVGDAVAYIEDLSGNENHRIQATVAKRPTLQQDPNGAYKLVYDGVDDFIDVTYSGVISTPISTVNVARKAPNSKILSETTDTGNKRLNIGIAGDVTLTFYALPSGGANSSAVGLSIPLGVEILILGAVWAQENSLYRINGVQNTGFFDPGPNSKTTGYRTATNNDNPPTDHTVLEEYGGIQIDRELTTEEFEKIEDYFELEVGIAHSGEFSPASLFAGGTDGAWYDPSDLSTLFQDSAGTTPVTASGQPVGKMLDKSGNGNHAVQATASKRPTYTTGGGLSWLAFDGVDDAMEIQNAAFSFTGDQSVWVAAKHDTGTGRYIYLMGGKDKGYLFLTERSTGRMRFVPITNGTSVISTSVIGTSPIVFGGAWNRSSGDTSLRENGVEYTASKTPADVTVPVVTLLGNGNTAGTGWDGNIYGAVIVNNLTTTSETGEVEAYLAAKSGVTL